MFPVAMTGDSQVSRADSQLSPDGQSRGCMGNDVTGIPSTSQSARRPPVRDYGGGENFRGGHWYGTALHGADTTADGVRVPQAGSYNDPSAPHRSTTAPTTSQFGGYPSLADSQYPSTSQQFSTASFPGNPGNPARNQLGESAGVALDSLPTIDIVSPQLRADILAGKDINLAALLIPGYRGSEHEACSRHLVVGDETVPLKPLTDSRMDRSLTIQQFIQAFTIFKNIMCEVYPNRQLELDTYLRGIIEMSSQFTGFTFYEYHKQFSARAAAWWARGVRVDWSKRDMKLYCSLFAGQRANACAICTSLAVTRYFILSPNF